MFQVNTKFGGLDILVSNAAVNPAVSPVLKVGICNLYSFICFKNNIGKQVV